MITHTFDLALVASSNMAETKETKAYELSTCWTSYISAWALQRRWQAKARQRQAKGHLKERKAFLDQSNSFGWDCLKTELREASPFGSSDRPSRLHAKLQHKPDPNWKDAQAWHMSTVKKVQDAPLYGFTEELLKDCARNINTWLLKAMI